MNFSRGARGLSWLFLVLPRILLLIWLASIGLTLDSDPQAWTMFSPVNLGVHETGHLIFSPFGKTLHGLGGTIAQCAAPVILGVSFLTQGDIFAIAWSGVWLATNLYNVAEYVADARARKLKLVTVGASHKILHDWHEVLSDWGLLEWDTCFGGILSFLAFLLMWVSIGFGGWFCWKISSSLTESSVDTNTGGD